MNENQMTLEQALEALDEAREEIKEQRKEIIALHNDLCKAEAHYKRLRELAAEVRPDLKV